MSSNEHCQKACEGCSCVARRGFFTSAAALAAGLLLWPNRALAKKLAIRLATVPQLKTVGGSVAVKIKGREVLLFRQSQSQVGAVAAHCTHKKTGVRYDGGKQRIVCPEHGSIFSLQGKVLKGPAKIPLPTFWTKLDAARGRVLLKL